MKLCKIIIVVKKEDLEKLQLILELYIHDVKINPFKKYNITSNLNIIFIDNKLIWTYTQYSEKTYQTYKTKYDYTELSIDYIFNNL